MGDVTVLKTAFTYEADMLADALEQEGVPHFRKMESMTAGELAMPAFPVQGPGVFFKVMVPEAAADHARQILANLPIKPGEPEFWSYNPRPWARQFVWWTAALVLVIFALSIIGQIIEWVVN